jgi:hypothetical protein
MTNKIIGGVAAIFISSSSMESISAQEATASQNSVPASMTVGEYITDTSKGTQYVVAYVKDLVENKLAPQQSDTPEIAELHKNMRMFLTAMVMGEDNLVTKLAEFIEKMHETRGGDALDAKKSLMAFMVNELPAFRATH